MYPESPTPRLFQQQYTPAFMSRWDELIDWEGRKRSENGFFEQVLSDAGAQTALDIACGTRYHTVTLSLNGFGVSGSDGSTEMLAKAKKNAAAHGVGHIQFRESEWAALTRAFPGGQ